MLPRKGGPSTCQTPGGTGLCGGQRAGQRGCRVRPGTEDRQEFGPRSNWSASHPRGQVRAKCGLPCQACHYLFVKRPAQTQLFIRLRVAESGQVAGNFLLFPPVKGAPINSSENPLTRRAEGAGGGFPGPRGQGGQPLGRPGSEHIPAASGALLPRGLSGSRPGWLPTPTGRKTPRRGHGAGRPRPALPALPGPATYVMAEGNGSDAEGRISQDWKSVRVKASRQPAAIFAIEDQSRLPPQPGKEGAGPGPRGGEGAPSARGAEIRGRARRGSRGAAGAAQGRGGRTLGLASRLSSPAA